MKDFNGKNVYITGGSSGIGLEMAKLFAAKGANVLIIARNRERLDMALDEIGKAVVNHRRLEACQLDVGNNGAVQQAMADVCASFGPPDVLINGAGFSIPLKFEDISFDQFDNVLKTNLYGVWSMCSALIRQLKQRQGYIVNVSSIAGFVGVFGYTNYCASKFGLIGFSEALRSEYEREGVRVSVLCPPDTDTPAYERENVTKPPETKAVSEHAKLMQPSTVAQVLLKGMAKEKFLIIPGFDGKLVHLAKGVVPGLVHRLMQRDIERANGRG